MCANQLIFHVPSISIISVFHTLKIASILSRKSGTPTQSRSEVVGVREMFVDGKQHGFGWVETRLWFKEPKGLYPMPERMKLESRCSSIGKNNDLPPRICLVSEIVIRKLRIWSISKLRVDLSASWRFLLVNLPRSLPFWNQISGNWSRFYENWHL